MSCNRQTCGRNQARNQRGRAWFSSAAARAWKTIPSESGATPRSQRRTVAARDGCRKEHPSRLAIALAKFVRASTLIHGTRTRAITPPPTPHPISILLTPQSKGTTSTAADPSLSFRPNLAHGGVEKQAGLAERGVDLLPLHRVAREASQAEVIDCPKVAVVPNAEHVVVHIGPLETLQLLRHIQALKKERMPAASNC